jgi:hypothetical protein
VWLALVACGARSGVDLARVADAQGGSSAIAGHGGMALATGGAAAGAGGSGHAGAGASTASGGASMGCPGSLAACGSQCRDLSSDPEACGSCGTRCGSNESCERGACVCEKPRLVRVSPANAQSSAPSRAPAIATFSCAPSSSIDRGSAMTVSGEFAARLNAAFPTPLDPNTVELEPAAPDPKRKQPYFPGELVTGWLGAPLGGPFLWQYRAATRRKSSANFQDTGQTLGAATHAVLGDLDHDGDLDVLTWAYGQAVQVWANDGHGTFSQQATIAALAQALEFEPVLADLDGDGDLDLAASKVFLNQGGFQFTESEALATPRLAVDVDGDGDWDLIESVTAQTMAVLKNDGHGRFTPAQMLQSSLTDLRAGDLDNDGDVDLVAITSLAQQQASVWLNDGSGNFTLSDAGIGVDASRGLSLGDVDGDGDLDVFVASWGAAGARNPPDRVWLNDGTAHFSAGDAPLTGSVQIAFADLDGDGDLDAVAGQHVPYSSEKGQPSQLLLNDGKGRFSLGGLLGGANFQRVVLGDLDGDGDLDAVVAQWDWTQKPPVQVWLQSG